MARQTISVEELFEAVCEQLIEQHPEDELGRMLHRPGIKSSGAFYAFTTKGDLVVKLPARRVADLIAAGDGRPCSPRPGHPMRQWVRLAPSSQQECAAYVAEARSFIAKTER
jgi:hypothetical protein